VPAGATCWLIGVEVPGSVTVEGTLISQGAKFDKNVTVNGGAIQLGNLNAEGSVVAGNLTITNSPLFSVISCPNSSNVGQAITGNITLRGKFRDAFCVPGIGRWWCVGEQQHRQNGSQQH